MNQYPPNPQEPQPPYNNGPYNPPTPSNPYMNNDQYAPTQFAQGTYPYSPPPPQKKRNPWLIGLLIGLVVVVVACVGITAAVSSLVSNGVKTSTPNTGTVATPGANTSGNNQQQATTQPADGTTPQTSGQSSSGQHFKLGEVVNVGGIWQITINSVKTSQGSEFEKPGDGNVFALVNLTAKNTSGKAQTLSSFLMFTLRDKDGQKYEESFYTGDSTASTPDGTVENGDQVKGVVPFKVPANIHDYRFSCKPSLFSDGLTIWDLTI